MAIIHGRKTDGKLGVLSHTEISSLLQGKSGGRAAKSACDTCATHIQDMNSSAGQGGITTKYAGRSVFHVSSGKRGGYDGCSTFFTLSDDNGPTPVAGIVAVGWHHGDKDDVYHLDWGKGAPFFTGNKLKSSRQYQKGNKV